MCSDRYEAPRLETTLQLVEPGDLFPGHDGPHAVIDWSERADLSIDLVCERPDGERYTHNGRPGSDFTIYA
jgi:hypothetical protein